MKNHNHQKLLQEKTHEQTSYLGPDLDTASFRPLLSLLRHGRRATAMMCHDDMH